LHPSNIQDISDAIKEIYRNSNLRNKLKAAGAAQALKFSLENFALNTIKAYES
jgi:glycosyltransferase involved in cell wall biosynthesis